MRRYKPWFQKSIWPAEEFIAVRLLEVELSQALPEVAQTTASTGALYGRLQVLVRLHGQPLGRIELPLPIDGLKPTALADAVWHALHEAINKHLQADGLVPIASLPWSGLSSPTMPTCRQEHEQWQCRAPFASVVVATRNRLDSLAVCLRSLLRLNYPQYEVIVVDNAPSTDATAAFVEQLAQTHSQVRYVPEDRPGTAWARNAGLYAARGEIVAFTDDDVIADSDWLAALARPMDADSNVGCVCGLIVPIELDTHAQSLIEQYGGFSKGWMCQSYNLAEHRPSHPLFPYAAGTFGSGANMAFRASVLRARGGFPSTLGGGTPALGGEDLAAFFEIINGGYTLVYEPMAIVHHLHHRSYTQLRRQVYSYGVGLASYLTHCAVEHPPLLLDIAAKVPYGLFFLLSARSPKNSKKIQGYPRELTYAELAGLLYGPFAYFRSRWSPWRRMQRATTDTPTLQPHG